MTKHKILKVFCFGLHERYDAKCGQNYSYTNFQVTSMFTKTSLADVKLTIEFAMKRRPTPCQSYFVLALFCSLHS